MKKNISNIIYILVILVILIETLLESEIIINSVKFSFNIWQNNIFTTLFPFFIIGDMLISLGFPELLNRFFKINSNVFFIIILSLISGFPSSAKYIKQSLDSNLIDTDEATRILTFTHFSNPLFIIGSVTYFIGNKSYGIPILISHYIGNFIIGIFMYKNNNKTFSYKKRKVENFGIIFSNAVKNGINTMLLILGTITTFLIVTSLINHIFNINGISKSIINGIFEMTQGLKYLESLDLNSNIKALISVGIISFGGLSVHMQILTILSETKIKYFPYFICRILHVFISCSIFFLWKIL